MYTSLLLFCKSKKYPLIWSGLVLQKNIFLALCVCTDATLQCGAIINYYINPQTKVGGKRGNRLTITNTSLWSGALTQQQAK